VTDRRSLSNDNGVDIQFPNILLPHSEQSFLKGARTSSLLALSKNFTSYKLTTILRRRHVQLTNSNSLSFFSTVNQKAELTNNVTRNGAQHSNILKLNSELLPNVPTHHYTHIFLHNTPQKLINHAFAIN